MGTEVPNGRDWSPIKMRAKSLRGTQSSLVMAYVPADSVPGKIWTFTVTVVPDGVTSTGGFTSEKSHS